MLGMIVKHYRGLLLGSSMMSAISAIAGILLIAFINQQVAAAGSSGNVAPDNLLLFLVGLVALFSLGTLSQVLLARLSTSVVAKLRGNIIHQVLSTDYAQLESAGGHRLQATMVTDVGAIAGGLTVLPTLLFNLTTVLLCIGYLAWLSPLYCGLLLVALGILAFGAYLLTNQARKYFMRLREHEDGLFQSFRTLIDGGKELSLNSQRKHWFFNQRVLPGIEQVKNTELTAQVFWSFNSSWTNLIVFGLMGLVVYGLYRLFPVSPEVLVSYIFVIIYFIGPLGFVITAMQPVTRAMVSYRKLNSLQLAGSQEQTLAAPCAAPTNDWHSLTIKGLKYHYSQAQCGPEETPFTVGPIDLTIKQGQMLFLTGGNGSGKSTFAKLLTGLYQPSAGSIVLGKNPLNEHNRDWYRNHFSTIFSDYFLFDCALDKAGQLAQDEAIAPLLQKLQLTGKVTSQAGVLSTTRLSQGQKKRLALLLAYLEDSPIMLFDEWAADQDPHFRHVFYHQLLPELKAQGKTLIVISHDDRYFHLADSVIKFDNGNAIELNPSEAGQAFAPAEPV